MEKIPRIKFPLGPCWKQWHFQHCWTTVLPSQMAALQNWPNILPTTGWTTQNPSILMSWGAAGLKFLPEQIAPHSNICWLSKLFPLSVRKHGNTAEFSPLIRAMNPPVPKEIHWLLCYSKKWNFFFFSHFGIFIRTPLQREVIKEPFWVIHQ